jgi:hypothetical protein
MIRISLIVAAILLGLSIPLNAQTSEASASFCLGALLEMMEYYNHHPENFPATSQSSQILAAVKKYTHLLDVAGLLRPPTWRSEDDVLTSIQRETPGREQWKACQSGSQDACRFIKACLQ